MKELTVVISTTGRVLVPTVTEIGLPGPPGPGILSNINRITASTTPPSSPEINDLWVDIS